MMFTSATQAGAIFLLVSSFSSSVLGGQFETLRDNTHAAVSTASQTAWAHFGDADRELAKLDHGERWAAIHDPDWQNLYQKQSRHQKAHHKAHLERHDKIWELERKHINREEHGEARKLEALRNYNGMVGKYTSSYPFNHLKGDRSGIDFSHLETLDAQSEQHKDYVDSL